MFIPSPVDATFDPTSQAQCPDEDVSVWKRRCDLYYAARRAQGYLDRLAETQDICSEIVSDLENAIGENYDLLPF
jgi:hypothetical protein